ncbi:MazG nucleotide pyrophosphohydrolase domain-containing protein [Longispora albida]|uniref:MazG nucleotide pyrophosphohydrolase domain-containing protein n=1 Tax=Longispora albida TaxID=203523 RepID=UPI000590D4B0|nr:MazG nucleotide pyrophosphohydrolase domain-containing protein [Longispora albida]
MSTPAVFLAEFHRAFGLRHAESPGLPPAEHVTVHRRLVEEEAAEAVEAMAGEDLAHIAQELADVVYVAYSAALAYGIDLDAVLAEIHRANMTKLGPDGLPVRREDGKVLKGPDFEPADVAAVLQRQAAGTK